MFGQTSNLPDAQGWWRKSVGAQPMSLMRMRRFGISSNCFNKTSQLLKVTHNKLATLFFHFWGNVFQNGVANVLWATFLTGFLEYPLPCSNIYFSPQIFCISSSIFAKQINCITNIWREKWFCAFSKDYDVIRRTALWRV